MESLAVTIKRIRDEKRMTMQEVARNSRWGEDPQGISTAYLSRIENGLVSNLSAKKQKSLARGLGVTVAEISAASLQENPDDLKITNERLARIDFGYKGMPPKKRKELDPLIDLLERELERMEREKEK